MKKILIFTIILLSFNSFSQGGKLQKADNYFEKLAYASASDIYENLLGSEVDSPEMKSKLAYCYFQMGEIANAEKTYAELVNSGACPTLDFYHYAQVLKQNGKYTDSDKWMKKYHDLAKTDSRAQEFIENENYIQKIEKAGNKFSIKNLKVNTSDADFGGYYLGEKAYFISNRSDNPYVKNVWLWNNKRFLDMYSSDMDSTSELVNSKMHTKRVNTKFHEGPVCFSPDGKKVIFTRNNIASGKERRDSKGIQNLKLYIADVIQDNIWLNEKEFQYNSKDFSIGHPTISNDGKYLYFVSDMPGGYGGADIYRVPILENFQFGKYENLGKTVNTEGQDMFPWINAENLLFFSSDGHVGLGGLDVFVAIPNAKGEYNKMLNVGKPVNSNRDDFAFIMDQTSRKGYFSSNRSGGVGDDDIYSYRLDRPFKAGIILKGTIKDNKTNEILANSDIILKDKDGNIVASIKSNDKGEYEFVLDDDTEYTLVGTQDKYQEEIAVIKTNSGDSPEINQDLNLNRIPQISLYCLITDAKSKKALDGVNLSVVELSSKAIIAQAVTPITGDFAKPMEELKIGDVVEYEIRLSKDGYLTKTVNFKYKIEKEGVINIHEQIDLSIGVMEVGGDLAKLIDIKPIYFDLGKFYIRPDAQIELDKIVKVMNEYPNLVVELGSHTDCRSSKAFNMKLSDKRAKASAAYIKARITKPERIYGKGYGEAKLINDCGCEGKIVTRNCSEEEHQQNRRTEFVIRKIGTPNVSVNKNVEATKGKLTYDPNKKFHIVESTDNLYIISVNNGVSVEEIKKLNNLKTDKVTVGQKLILRSSGSNDTKKDTDELKDQDKELLQEQDENIIKDRELEKKVEKGIVIKNEEVNKITKNDDSIKQIEQNDNLSKSEENKDSIKISVDQKSFENQDNTHVKIIEQEKNYNDLTVLLNLNPIYYDLNSSYFRKESIVELDKVVNYLTVNSRSIIMVRSHTDCREDNNYNFWLSKRRAERVVLYLKGKIKDPERVNGEGLGESELINSCECDSRDLDKKCSEEQHQKNRRTEFIILKQG